LLVSPDNIGLLEAADRDDVGVADIWLTQAFQGGRISETLKLRLGCVGLVGTAQPYLWRDISKVNVVDYGMPCYLPVGGTAASRDPIGFRVPLVRGVEGGELLGGPCRTPTSLWKYRKSGSVTSGSPGSNVLG
jgi:hypothetical protein